MDTEAFDRLLKHNGFVTPTCLAEVFAGEDSPSYGTQTRWLIKWARLRGLHKSPVTLIKRSMDQGGGTTWCYVYHLGELTQEQMVEIKARYKRAKLAIRRCER
jgi:hypothetical protein